LLFVNNPQLILNLALGPLLLAAILYLMVFLLTPITMLFDRINYGSWNV
jgi:hypothetical protein